MKVKTRNHIFDDTNIVCRYKNTEYKKFCQKYKFLIIFTLYVWYFIGNYTRYNYNIYIFNRYLLI